MSAGVPETAMPEVRRADSGEQVGRPGRGSVGEGVEIPVANGDHEHLPRSQILHKKATGLKFN